MVENKHSVSILEPAKILDDWVYRCRNAVGVADKFMLMLHGWTGNENSMEFFTRAIPDRYTLFLPRAPYRADQGGFSWREDTRGSWGLPTLDELSVPASNLLLFLDTWSAISHVDVSRIDVAGFSQGAALAYTLGMLFPDRVNDLIILSGFLPAKSTSSLPALKGKKIYISHGRNDELVPIENSRSDLQALITISATVTYCESDGGHKVGKECLRGVETFVTVG
jgi:phospholipase/carboxylesterase